MDPPIIPFPRRAPASTAERDLAEVDVAIALVAAGLADPRPPRRPRGPPRRRGRRPRRTRRRQRRVPRRRSPRCRAHGRAARLVDARSPTPDRRRGAGEDAGPSAGRSARPRRAPAVALLPHAATGRRRRPARRRSRPTAGRTARRADAPGRCSAGRWRATRSRANGCRSQGARGLLERQPLVGRLRDRGHPVHAARGRHGGVLADAADLAPHRGDPRDHRRLVPPDDPRPTRTAAAATSSRRRTSGRRPGSSPPRRS